MSQKSSLVQYPQYISWAPTLNTILHVDVLGSALEGRAETLSHADVWRAVDRLAVRCGTSPSGLARRAGLEPMTFNKSKRITKEGKQRWPQSENLGHAAASIAASVLDTPTVADASDVRIRSDYGR
jgi:hypothetical protein